MELLHSIFILYMLSVSSAINRSVYKVALHQKGYAQFIQYDIEIPPMREFTFCTWVLLHDLDGDQSIFTYIENGNNRVVRLWLDSGGFFLRLSINDKASSQTPVDFGKNIWRHVCLSYQSDFGAWALYLDSVLLTCEASRFLIGYVLPGGGSVIVGYGTAINGIQNGLEGEIFGANLMLASTIERNTTVKNNALYFSKPFNKNIVKNSNEMDYVVLGNLHLDERNNDAVKEIEQALSRDRHKNYIKIKTPHSQVSHDVGIKFSSRESSNLFDLSNETEFQDSSEATGKKLWNILNKVGRGGKTPLKNNREIIGSGTHDFPTISEFETPPPPSQPDHNNFIKSVDVNLPGKKSLGVSIKSSLSKTLKDKIPDFELPPLPEDDSAVYGQWTSSKYAGQVLNYLKSINFQNKRLPRVPATIPQIKVSDAFPYPSGTKVSMIKPDWKKNEYWKNNVVATKRLPTRSVIFYPKTSNRAKVMKRHANEPEINVRIIEDDLRSTILKSHSATNPVDVEVTSRGEIKKIMDHRFYRDVNYEEFENLINSDLDQKITSPSSFITVNHNLKDFSLSNRFMAAMPFLKSKEYFTEKSKHIGNDYTTASDDMYTKSLSDPNKWHNVRPQSSGHSLRFITSALGRKSSEDQFEEGNKNHPSINIKYKPEKQKVEPFENNEYIKKGINLAKEMSTPSDQINSISLFKYNHGYLPGHEQKKKLSKKHNGRFSGKSVSVNSFNEQVKIGNALNEKNIIGTNEEERQHSFLGGDEKIPDLHRYRSDIDNETSKVPSSLGPKVCKNLELYNRLLFIQDDGSVDINNILSPLKEKNIAMEFVRQNYKMCSLHESGLASHPLLLIHWNTTPLKLFGGAVPKKTKDLCGFF